MNDKEIIVYKVFIFAGNNKFKSSFIDTNPQYYELNQWSTCEDGLPFFAFKTKEQALKWIRQLNGIRRRSIIKCKAIKSKIQVKECYMSDMYIYMVRGAKDITYELNALKHRVPVGTILVDKVIPMELIK